MHPTNTIYRLVKKHEYKICHKLIRDNKIPNCRLTYPTVVAERGDKIIGVLATMPDKLRIIAGPLVVDPSIKVRSFIALRLIEAYEMILRLSGVSFYFFNIFKTDDKWIKIVEKHSKFLGEGKIFRAYRKEVTK